MTLVENSLQQLTANLDLGKVRRTNFRGRSYLVAPVTMIVPGVLAGSNGPVYYSQNETAKNPLSWDFMPITVPHPMKDGKPVSARDSVILNEIQVGFVLNSSFTSKLGAEAWFDEEDTKRVDIRVYNKLEKGEPIETSTGLFLDLRPLVGNHNGKEYAYEAYNFRPDHLAVLPDAIGACSLKDGCGILVNESTEKEAQGWLGKVNSILNLMGLKELTLLTNREPGSAPTITNTNPRGAEISHTKKEPDMAGKLAEADRKTLVDNLISNCGCSGTKIFNEEDREYLTKLPDERLTALDAGRNRMAANEKTLANATKSFEYEGTTFVFNAEKGAYEPKAKEAPKTVKIDGKDFVFNAATNSYVPATAEITTNTKPPEEKPMTDEEFLRKAPPQVRAVVQNAIQIQNRERAELIERILATNKTFTQDQLEKLPLDSELEVGKVGLRSLAAMAPAQNEQQAPSLVNYFGASAPVTNLSKDDKNDILRIPTMNFDMETTAAKTA